jgi:hypothetical protein
MQLSIQKTILPKEEWVKFEEVSMISFSKQFIILVKIGEYSSSKMQLVFLRISTLYKLVACEKQDGEFFFCHAEVWVEDRFLTSAVGGCWWLALAGSTAVIL